MLLAIDAGNTNIVFAVYEGQVQKDHWRCETSAGVMSVFEEIKARSYQVDSILISSVVPKIKDNLVQRCQRYFNQAPNFVTFDNAGVEIVLDKPAQVGADRLVNAAAVLEYYQAPAIVLDFGTATTFDVIDEEGRYCGGVIAPGINLSLGALQQAAEKLPNISVDRPDHVIGKNTVDAMQSGIYWGYIGLIEGTIQRISKEMGCKPLVIATGGLASLFSEGTKMIDIVDPDLILKGLVHIHATQLNMKSGKAA